MHRVARGFYGFVNCFGGFISPGFTGNERLCYLPGAAVESGKSLKRNLPVHAGRVCKRYFVLLTVLLLLGNFAVMRASAGLPPVSPFYDIPYTMTDAYTGSYAGNSLAGIADQWWPDYQKRWDVSPYGWRNCSYILGTHADGPVTGKFGYVQLTGQCSGGNSIFGTRKCPSGYDLVGNTCVDNGEADREKNIGKPPECGVGNPVHPGTGNKYQQERDSGGVLEMARYYNSQFLRDVGMGPNWTYTYSRGITILGNNIRVIRDDGYTEYFDCTSAVCQGASDTRFRITRDADGYTLADEDETVETYDVDGTLQQITDIRGVSKTLGYDPQGRLERVDRSTGEYIRFVRNDRGHIEFLFADNESRVWGYSYDAHGNLAYVDNPAGTTRQYHYEDAVNPNALTGITDERGIRYATYEYNPAGEATASYHGPQTDILTDRIDGVSIVYNADGTRVVTNSNGNSSVYSFLNQIGASLVSDVSGPGCQSCSGGDTRNTYDPLTNNLLSRIENDSQIKYGNYDARGNYRCKVEGISSTDTVTGECTFDPASSPDARRTDYTYHPDYFSKIETITEPSVHPGASKVTSYTYDDFGNRTSEIITGYGPDGTRVSRTTRWEYNGPLHQLSAIDGPRTEVADIARYRYYPDDPAEGNNRARLKEVEDARGVLVRSNIQYTTLGKVASETRPNGRSLTYSYYPGNGRLETLSESNGSSSQVTRWTYLATGEVETITTADGTPDAMTVAFAYDDARRLVRITDGLGNSIEYGLDTEGNRTHEKTYDSNGFLKKSLAQTFDIYSRLDTTSQANEWADYDYAADGTLSQLTDGKGSVTGYDYDDLNRLLARTQDLGGVESVTRYGYDVADNLTRVTDPVNGTTRYVYDDLGNLLSTTSPDTGTTAYTYDEAGNIRSRQDARGQILVYSYDALNRLTGVDAPGAADDVVYGYDICAHGVGRLCSVVTPEQAETYAYDSFGNITGHQDISYRYDAANRLRAVTYPSGAVVAYGYDAAGRVSRVDLSLDGVTTTLASDITYAPFGLMERLVFANGAALSQTTDSAYRMTAQSIPGVMDIGYSAYDANGNLEGRTSTYAGPGYFSYDPMGRLDTASGVFGDRDYDYDLNGNRTNLGGDASIAYSYMPNSNRLLAETGWSYTLDANGNVTHRLAADGQGRSFTYTAHNRLATVTGHVRPSSGKGKKNTALQDMPVSAYGYNGLGQRSSKQVEGGAITQFLYGTGGALMVELDGSGAVQREYVYLNDQLLALLEQNEPGSDMGAETILDNGVPPAGWTAKTSNRDYGADYLYSTGGSGNPVRWTSPLEAGSYEVYARWLSGKRYSNSVPYSIRHAGQTDIVNVDQARNGGAWQLLGTFSFDGKGDEYIEVSDATGKTTADAVRFVKTGGDTGGTAVTRVYYVHNDHLGTPQVMTDEQGGIVWRAFHDPFGRATVGAASTVEMNIRFPGQYYDAETGLHYNYYRYYDPETGRYLTSDPRGIRLDYSDPQRQIALQMGIGVPVERQHGYLNHNYSYARNNPVNRIDPTGEIDPGTIGLVIWGLLYLNNAGDAISQPNGNLSGSFIEQDDSCSLGPFGLVADSCPNIKKRCIRHDGCYEMNECNATSWLPTLIGGTKACNRCNTGFFSPVGTGY